MRGCFGLILLVWRTIFRIKADTSQIDKGGIGGAKDVFDHEM